MTYFGFLVRFLVVPSLVLLLIALWDRRRGRQAPAELRAFPLWAAIAIHMFIALVYTTPWDNYLVATRVWWYDPELVSGIILGVSQSARWGWTDTKTIGSVAIGSLLGAYLIRRSSRHPRPMLDLDLFRFAPFRLANIASILFGSTFFAVFFGFPRFTQEVWGYDVRDAGLLLMPASRHLILHFNEAMDLRKKLGK